TALATHIIILLGKESAIRKESGLNFEKKDKLVVVVCDAIRRAIGPFQLVMDAILSNNDDLRQCCSTWHVGWWTTSPCKSKAKPLA
ncbi:MAG: hypothetical protein ACKPKO_57840, partial [Candidatus Fonsibacter sp.]